MIATYIYICLFRYQYWWAHIADNKFLGNLGENKLKINVFVKINYQNENKYAHIVLFQRVIIFINDYAVIYST